MGACSPFLSVPLTLLHKSTKLSLDQLALIETLGIGAHAVVRSQLRGGEEALVIGVGPIGLAAAQFAQAAGATVRVMEKNESRRSFAARLGFEAQSEHDDRLADVVFDATGNANSMERAYAMRPRLDAWSTWASRETAFQSITRFSTCGR